MYCDIFLCLGRWRRFWAFKWWGWIWGIWQRTSCQEIAWPAGSGPQNH